MGYVYGYDPLTGREKLACDYCGKIGDVRKHNCPFGYCQPVAMCPSCWEKHKKTWRSEHIKSRCDEYESEFQEREQTKKGLLNQGYMVRVAAEGMPNKKVKVWFRDISGNESQYMMDESTYHAIPLMTPATLESYKRHGKVTRMQ